MTFDGQCLITGHQTTYLSSGILPRGTDVAVRRDLEDIFGELRTPEKKSWSLFLEVATALSQKVTLLKRESCFLGAIKSLLIHSKFRARVPRLQRLNTEITTP